MTSPHLVAGRRSAQAIWYAHDRTPLLAHLKRQAIWMWVTGSCPDRENVSKFSTPRHRDVTYLSWLDECTAKVARERLEGRCGDETRVSSRSKVAAFREAVQQRMAANGVTDKEAELALLAERDQLPDAVFPEVRPRRAPWENLYGVQVRCERTGSGYTQVREGVILPPVIGGGRKLRIGLTMATPQHPAGSVLTILADRWHITPDPLEARGLPWV